MGSILAQPIVAGISMLLTKITDYGTCFKWIAAYLYIKAHRRRTKSRFDLYDMDALGDPVKVGLLPPKEEIILESPHDESHLSKAADEILFYGVNSSSECFMSRISRIGDDEAEIGLYLKLRNGNTYELEEIHCRHRTSKSSNRMFAGGGLKMCYIEPMRKWRIFFKGLLREVSVNNESSSRMVYVKFGLQWAASTDCFDTLSDINCSDLARTLARSKWEGFLPDLTIFHDAVNSYHQCGIIRGEVHIDGADKEMELYVFGEKIRYLGSATKIEGYKFSQLLGHITKNGRIVNITELNIPNIAESLLIGYVVTPEGKVETATNIDVKEGHLWNERSLNISLRTDELDFNLKAFDNEETPIYEMGRKQEYQMSMKNMSMELNSRPGRGILVEGYISKPQKKRAPRCISESILKDTPLTVDFSDDVCQIPHITGGKGSSLGKLTQLSKKYQNFIVPKGIVVTTSAYQKFVTEDILKEVKILADVLYGNISGDVKEACDRTINTVIGTELPKEVHESIADHLKKEFGDDECHQKMFAIRSSATGEDSEDMSAAGQMETYLGVTKLNQITLSVKKCWASQFSYVSVQYKRQNGQELNSPMAVVIQEMVLCDVAGVLFTCDPLTGNPTLMSITANYGLGESVVSGSVEPDTITLERSADESLKIKEKMIGAKSHRMIIKGESGPIQEDVPDSKREECALSDRLCLRLGKIALLIEKCYHSERDIEWGFLTDNFYIFQSRPVTSNNEETDYEIDHEHDIPIRVENEYFTVGNIGEVMPGALSPLGIEVQIKFFNITLQRKLLSWWNPFNPKYCPKGLVTMYNHGMMLATDLFQHVKKDGTLMKSQMISIFGRVIEDKELFELVKERFETKKKMRPTTIFLAMLTNVYISLTVLKRTRKYYEENRIPLDSYRTSADLFDALLNACTYPGDALICHFICTNNASMGNMFLLSAITKSNGEIDTDVYNDLSELMSSIKEVESADVPSSMENLAYQIGKDIDPTEFQKMSIEDAENWLMSSTTCSGQAFREFLNKHGHRCLREFDVRPLSWGENPKHLVKILQSLTRSVSKERSQKRAKSFQELTSKLKTPLNARTRILLKYLILPIGRRGVRSREAGKSLLVRAINEWRKGYRKLAKLMVSEGRIPDEDLLYFMTLLEIQELLSNRSPKIIARAVHRRRRYPILDSYLFPEITSGIPKPVNMDLPEIMNNDENFSMKGIPVSKGVTKGFIRVALTLEEASFLKPGEILVTYSTDIGWSPYFPALGGVVTELGGLISHGAVVSREYGLPCIAGLHGATRQFQTGDYVLLDANKGILKKLPQPE